MIVTQSKKELFRDNCQMRDELERLIIANIELVMLNDKMRIELEQIKQGDKNGSIND